MFVEWLNELHPHNNSNAKTMPSSFLTRTFILLLAGILYAFSAAGVTAMVRGKVVDANTDEPLPFVNIVLMQEGAVVAGSASDFDGKFTINPVPVGTYELEATFTGYKPSRQTVIVEAEKVVFVEVRMETAELELAEVVVIECGPSSKSVSTNSADAMPVRTTVAVAEVDAVPDSKPATKAEEGSIPPQVRSQPHPMDRADRATRTDFVLSSPTPAATYTWSDGAAPASFGDTPMAAGTYTVTVTDSNGAAAAPSEALNKESAGTVETGSKAGTLTAGEIHDFSKWKLWEDLAETDLNAWQAYWQVTPQNRYAVQLMNDEGWPLVDKEISLVDAAGATIYTARTDNTGKAELWSDLFGMDAQSATRLVATVDGTPLALDKPKLFHDGVNTLIAPVPCGAPNALDIMFVVDATGSMGDEINYLKAELADVISRAQGTDAELQINLGSIFYRDHGDEYLTREAAFSSDISQTVEFMKRQRAGGGGDYPEAVATALRKAVRETEWSTDARARILFLVLDAPPHKNDPILKDLQQTIREAAAKGIRVVPVTASGLDKRTEYLMRAMALATNGTYTFLTDDSGVGGSHIAPTTDKWDVEKLNDLLVRIIHQFTETAPCNSDALVSHRTAPVNPAIGQGLEAGKKQLTIFPNPTRGPLTVELKGTFDEVLLTDMTGKVMQRFAQLSEHGTVKMDLSELATGIYFVLARAGSETVSERIVLAR